MATGEVAGDRRRRWWPRWRYRRPPWPPTEVSFGWPEEKKKRMGKKEKKEKRRKKRKGNWADVYFSDGPRVSFGWVL